MKSVAVKARVGGKWRTCGKLIFGGAVPIFEQKIPLEARLWKFGGAAGIDLEYDPLLPANCIIRHVVEESPGKYSIFEISLKELQRHPNTVRARVGHKHSERLYLDYRYWRRSGGSKPIISPSTTESKPQAVPRVRQEVLFA